MKNRPKPHSKSSNAYASNGTDITKRAKEQAAPSPQAIEIDTEATLPIKVCKEDAVKAEVIVPKELSKEKDSPLDELEVS